MVEEKVPVSHLPIPVMDAEGDGHAAKREENRCKNEPSPSCRLRMRQGNEGDC
jgi:hypothetical protein